MTLKWDIIEAVTGGQNARHLFAKRTFMFLFFAFAATQVANAGGGQADTAEGSLSQAPNTSVLLYISLAFGFSLAVNVWIFFRISGGLFNPAVGDIPCHPA